MRGVMAGRIPQRAFTEEQRGLRPVLVWLLHISRDNGMHTRCSSLWHS
jgi:hypothetical protein